MACATSTARRAGGMIGMLKRTDVMRSDLESLVLPHQEPDLFCCLAFQELGLPDAPLLPFARVLIKPVHLALPARQML